MALHRALITINAVSQNPDDVTTNTLYFDVDDIEASGPLITSQIQTFYQSLNNWWSDQLAPSGSIVQFYQLSDPPPRRVVYQGSFQLLDTGADTLPTECAVVMSYQAEPVSGLPQARRRGRIYLGPFSKGSCDVNGYVTPALVTDVRDAGQALYDASELAAGWTWSTYSPTDNQGDTVRSGWCDNAWDTQRRRGRESTNRSVWNS